MKLFPFLIIVFLFIVGSCSHKAIRVDDEFLNAMSEEEVQQTIQFNNDQLTLSGLKYLALKARLADENAQLEAKRADLSEKIS